MSPTVAGTTKIASRSSLADVAAEVADAVETCPLDLMSDHNVVEFARRVEELGRQVDALRVTIAGEIDARATLDNGEGSLAHRHGCRNAIELLQRVTLVSARVTGKRIALARVTRAEIGFSGHIIPPKFPAVAAALEAHTISSESAEIITRTLGNLPASIEQSAIAYAERCLVAAGCGDTPPDETTAVLPDHADNIRVMCMAWVAALDQDGPEPDFDEQQQRRYFRLGRESHGMVPVHGALLPEVAAVIGRLFDAINSPRAGEGGLGREGGSDGTGEGESDSESAGRANSAGKVRFTAVTGAAADGSPDGSSTYAPVDPRTPDQKRHDAMAAIAQAASQHKNMPTLGGAAVTVLIQVEEEKLVSGQGAGWLHGHDGVTTPISMAGVEHAACSGSAQRVTQNSDGRIIELGTQQRVFNAHQRRVIALRDGGCVIPGCTVPATWCEIHHVAEYADGGPTHTDNGVTACWYHHRSLGTSGWEIRMREGLPEVLAPPWVDPAAIWRRAHPPVRPPGLRTARSELEHLLAESAR